MTTRPVAQHNVTAEFKVGQVVRHKFLNFRGVVYDVDPVFDNSEEWYRAIPKQFRPDKEQPFYHLLAENDEAYYTAYVSQQNLVTDKNGPIDHPELGSRFGPFSGEGYYPMLDGMMN